MSFNIREKIAGALFLIGLVGATYYEVIGRVDAGKPLQSYTLATVVAAPPGSLPRFIRLTESVPHADLTWFFTGTGKARVFVSEMPRTTSDWHPGQPVQLIELDDAESGDCHDLSGGVEGALSLPTLPPGWGSYENPYKWRATVPVYTLHCLPLHGKMPNTGQNGVIGFMLSTWPPALFFLVWSLCDSITAWKKKRDAA